MSTSRGKWSQPEVPHKGWICCGVTDLDEPSATCQMCEEKEIRYVHHMEHPEWPERLDVGCVCAEHMEEGYDGKAAERELRRRAARRKRFAQPWRDTRGHWEHRVDGERKFSVLRTRGGFRAYLRHGRQTLGGKKLFPSVESAKLALFDFVWPARLPRVRS